MKTCVPLLVLTIVCSAQSVSPSFDEEYSRAIERNPPGVTLTIATIPEHSTCQLSDVLRFKVTFTSKQARLYTAELGGGGSAAGGEFRLRYPRTRHGSTDSFTAQPSLWDCLLREHTSIPWPEAAHCPRIPCQFETDRAVHE